MIVSILFWIFAIASFMPKWSRVVCVFCIVFVIYCLTVHLFSQLLFVVAIGVHV